MSYNSDNKIVDLDNRRRNSDDKPVKLRKRKKNWFKQEYIGVIIFVIILATLCINLFFYKNKSPVPMYEVQAEDVSKNTIYKGIALRSEEIVNTEYSGYINYFVQNRKRSARNGIIFSVDEDSNLYNKINEHTGLDKLEDNDVKSIKNVIYGYLDHYSDFNFCEISEFKQEISDTIYELVNDNNIENMKRMSGDNVSSALHVKRTNSSGIISYKNDSLCGITFNQVTPDMFEDDYSLSYYNYMSTGLVQTGEPIYRIVTDDNWQIAVKIPEDVYIKMLEFEDVTLYINNYYKPVTGELKMVQEESDYYALISLDKYMSLYADQRFLDIEFDMEKDTGLKIPTSAISEREFYLVPLSMFMDMEGQPGQVLLREGYDEEGESILESVYTTRYYTDGFYAYVDMSLFDEGDTLVNTDTGERIHISLKNTLEGVYNVNKGYYQFVRIEKMRANGEYAIIKNNTEKGLRLFDHIALNAKDAIDQAIIY